MDKIRKLFGNREMTWKRLIIFSVLCAVYTAAMLLIPGINETALREIGVGFECWFILAIFVVSNCGSAKEAAVKCFVFFLISQPLIYLIQSPFVHRNLIAEYYKPWLIKTFLTIPGGFIAYQIKRKDLLGSLVLAVAGIFLSYYGVDLVLANLSPFRIDYVLYGLLLVAAAVMLGFIFCGSRKLRTIYLIIILAAGLTLGAVTSQNALSAKNYDIALSEGDWYISSCSYSKMEAEIVDGTLKITYYGSSSTGEVLLENGNGDRLSYSLHVENGELVIIEN